MGAERHQLNAMSPMPLYYQIMQELRRRIEDGEFVPGTPVLSEREICVQYGVSRPTARQAVQELINQGLLERWRGIGTYVAHPKIPHRLGSLLGFSERIIREGRQPGTRVIEQGLLSAAAAGDAVRAQLGLEPANPVFRLMRLRLVDGEPVLLETVHLPLQRFPDLDRIDFETHSLYHTLRTQHNVEVVQLRETLEPVLLTPGDASLLEGEAGQPAMLARITTCDQSGQAIEHTFSLARADRFQYYIELNLGERVSEGGARLRQTQLEVSLPA